MDLEESRFRATWKRFLEVLKVDHYSIIIFSRTLFY